MGTHTINDNEPPLLSLRPNHKGVRFEITLSVGKAWTDNVRPYRIELAGGAKHGAMLHAGERRRAAADEMERRARSLR